MDNFHFKISCQMIFYEFLNFGKNEIGTAKVQLCLHVFWLVGDDVECIPCGACVMIKDLDLMADDDKDSNDGRKS
jgi:hypothetical protein